VITRDNRGRASAGRLSRAAGNGVEDLPPCVTEPTPNWTAPDENELLRTFAYHEAGHAVAAICTGSEFVIRIAIGSALTNAERARGLRGLVETEIPDSLPDDPTHLLEICKRRMIVKWAGPTAQMIATTKASSQKQRKRC
jgi:hypothetical protein